MIASLIVAALVVASVIAHELAHGCAALWQGDDTALRAGRLTWNPLTHADVVNTIAIPLVTFLASHGAVVLGGAKPVPVNPRRYRDGARSEILVSLAGVVVNAELALLGFAFASFWPPLMRVACANAGLVAFNLLPIAPLDGWRVWRCVRDARRRRRAMARSSLG